MDNKKVVATPFGSYSVVAAKKIDCELHQLAKTITITKNQLSEIKVSPLSCSQAKKIKKIESVELFSKPIKKTIGDPGVGASAAGGSKNKK